MEAPSLDRAASPREVEATKFGNAQFSTFKAALTDLAVSKLRPIGAEMKRLLADPAAIDAVLADGAARAQKMARETMNAVKDVVGFVRS
jgi:tryptophanyl-tRNA synthetase